jgi:hypothetical protein
MDAAPSSTFPWRLCSSKQVKSHAGATGAAETLASIFSQEIRASVPTPTVKELVSDVPAG